MSTQDSENLKYETLKIRVFAKSPIFKRFPDLYWDFFIFLTQVSWICSTVSWNLKSRSLSLSAYYTISGLLVVGLISALVLTKPTWKCHWSVKPFKVYFLRKKKNLQFSFVCFLRKNHFLVVNFSSILTHYPRPRLCSAASIWKASLLTLEMKYDRKFII